MTDQRDNLISVVQFFRHGQRTPGIFLPSHPYQIDAYWPSGPTELTTKGRLQLYELGQFTRQRYSTFLPDLYSKKDFALFSTSKDTTLASAQLFAAGLYPPIDAEIWKDDIRWRPIPVRETDDYLLSVTPYDHPHANFRKLFDLFIRAYQEEHANEVTDIGDYISKHTNDDQFDIIYCGMLFDSLWCAASYGLKLPDWANKVYPEPITRITRSLLKGYYHTQESRRICGGPIMYEMFQHFKKVNSKPSQGPKLIAYACHDHNLIGLYETLGIKNYVWPSVASSVYFELRKSNDGPYVNIYCKKEDGVTDLLPITISGANFDCPLDDYKKILGNCFVSKEQIRKEAEQFELEGGLKGYRTIMDEFREKLYKKMLVDTKDLKIA